MSKREIEFLKITHLNGPSMWTYRPVLEALIDIHDLEDAPSNTIPGFYERLTAWLPSLVEHRCSYEERGGFLRRLQEGTWPGHILEHVTLELQNLAGLPGGFGKARDGGRRGVYKVVVRAWQEDVTRAALHAARDLVMAAIEDKPFDVAGTVERLSDMADSLCLGPSTASIVDAADDRDIPTIRLIPDANLVQIGYGAALRRIWTAETDRTSAIAETISRDKDLTKFLLSSCGVPVPEGREVNSPEDAWEAAVDIGLPVCVKPTDGNHGRGVFIDVKTREEIEQAYAVALEEGSGVLVERSIPGTEHRLLVVGGTLAAACRGDVVCVVGDGVSTVRELIESQINSDPRRGQTELHPLSLIRLDSAAVMELSRQGLEGDSVPPSGKEVLIQRNANHAFDVTDLVHPDNAALAALAARIVGLDIAGIDLVAEDISKPLLDQGGAIVEVNAGPSLLMHLKPAVGEPRPVGKSIVGHLFPEGQTGRIPIVGITGSKGKTAVARFLRHLTLLSGKYVALASSDGLFLDQRHVQKTDASHWAPARRVLLNRAVELAIFENGARAILGEGLAYDRCQVGVVTNLDPEEQHLDYAIDDHEMLYKVFRTQVDVILKGGAAVLNAADPQLVEMSELCDGEVIFFAASDANPVVATHIGKGGRAVFARREELILATGNTETRLARLADVPTLRQGEEAFRLENALAAVAAGWALDVPLELLAAGVKTFEQETQASPRRQKKN
ncbi:MAG TPA: cyanophycin synthetase [Rhodocyclaceae bacterium]|nr:cyanophycin synthetase [Rhodocyclaceae bacterium]HNM81733.1 cyanophycin synthetase [Rhodocyclaceae bacterium]